VPDALKWVLLRHLRHALTRQRLTCALSDSSASRSASRPPIIAFLDRSGGQLTSFHPMTLGQPLPTLPIWLDVDQGVFVDLETNYEETCVTGSDEPQWL